MHSMTAYATLHKSLGGNDCCWELRSVNHRYLDVSFRMPEMFRHLETELRQRLRGVIHRGKVECQLKMKEGIQQTSSIGLDFGLIQALLQASATLESQYGLPNDVKTSTMLQWPGIILAEDNNMQGIHGEVLECFDEAIQQLALVRATEGDMLKKHIHTRLLGLQDVLAMARANAKELEYQTKAKLMHRLESLQIGVLEERVEQELAMILTRLDVHEELDRLDTHIHEVGRVLNQNEPIGKRLDFLMQELNREANTIGSKSDSIILTQHAVEMKVLIEQMREQIQNIE